MSGYKRGPDRWNPPEDQGQLMMELFKQGVSQIAIADAVGRDPSTVNRWFSDRFGAYHAPRHPRFSKDAMHKDMGVYFDITTLWEGAEDERR